MARKTVRAFTQSKLPGGARNTDPGCFKAGQPIWQKSLTGLKRRPLDRHEQGEQSSLSDKVVTVVTGLRAAAGFSMPKSQVTGVTT